MLVQLFIQYDCLYVCQTFTLVQVRMNAVVYVRVCEKLKILRYYAIYN